ncbi:GNAT family N-acetyltransferase [Zooshikella harenae]|uniref:GNAT family N-acetyltransferase n=1 Tax=Zooshikella harenae TaxID=2827238 RepID=A0ABS5ZAY7_9GAMM|nr:GNAT family N-acetyltransferase [Zooshikella harenae]MBU2711219.1 GNAT family N-acetyltransferase [Zooshikella harenae]
MYIREIVDNDWRHIEAIQAQSYYEIKPEALSVLQSKCRVSPQTCKVCIRREAVMGYLLAHPWLHLVPPKLHEEIKCIEEACSRIYLHDLAVAQQARHEGVARRLMEDFLATASEYNYQEIILVSVQQSEVFWSKYGFKKVDHVDICHSYGPNRQLMIKTMS